MSQDRKVGATSFVSQLETWGNLDGSGSDGSKSDTGKGCQSCFCFSAAWQTASALVANASPTPAFCSLDVPPQPASTIVITRSHTDETDLRLRFVTSELERKTVNLLRFEPAEGARIPILARRIINCQA